MIEQGPDRIRVTATSINTLQSVGDVKVKNPISNG